MIKIAIGTAQFGQNYGICNAHGSIEGDKASKIVNTAFKHGINIFDTASMYGDSENVLGTALCNNINQPYHASVITKFYADSGNIDALYTDFEASHDKLGTEKIYGILIHNADVLLSTNGEEVWRALQNIQKEHNISKIGASVYTPEDLIELSQRYELGLVQLPCNLLDQRFLTNDIQSLKHERNIEFHARSLFLQGLLVQGAATLPNCFSEKKDVFEKIKSFTEQQKLSKLELCLKFADWTYQEQLIDCWVIGVDTNEHLKDIVKTIKGIEDKELIEQEILRSLATNDLNIIDPRRWKRSDD